MTKTRRSRTAKAQAPKTWAMKAQVERTNPDCESSSSQKLNYESSGWTIKKDMQACKIKRYLADILTRLFQCVANSQKKFLPKRRQSWRRIQRPEASWKRTPDRWGHEENQGPTEQHSCGKNQGIQESGKDRREKFEHMVNTDAWW